MFRRRPHASSAVLMAPRLSPTLLAALGLASCDGCRDLPLGACLEPAPVNDDGDPRVGPCLTPMANPPPDQPPPDQRPPEDPPFGACLKIAPPDPDPVTHPNARTLPNSDTGSNPHARTLPNGDTGSNPHASAVPDSDTSNGSGHRNPRRLAW